MKKEKEAVMLQLDLIVRNGFLVLTDNIVKADIGIKDGIIIQIEENMQSYGKEEYDAYGQYIFPGMIDVHVHFSEPGREHWEGFKTGTQMLAAGGCTTFFDMPLNGIPSTVNEEALFEKAKIGEKKSLIDFGLWGGLVPGNEEELAKLANGGVIGFKAFLSESGNEEFERVDDDTLLEGMRTIASLQKILALHAESNTITSFLKKEKEQAGLYSADDYAETRPILAEVEAVERAILYSEVTGCSLHFVHISSALAVEKIQQAKKRGLDITVETCPHYLLFNHNDLVEKGAVAKCAPPLRDEEEQRKLISLLIADEFDMISSDHSPSPYEMKDSTKYNLFQAWGGISGGQFSLLSMIELALAHEIPFTKVAKWTAESPAQRFGLNQKKGQIKVGLDADLAIVSLENTYTVAPHNFLAKHKESVYMGHTFPCEIAATVAKGKIIYKEGTLYNDSIRGEFCLKR